MWDTGDAFQRSHEWRHMHLSSSPSEILLRMHYLQWWQLGSGRARLTRWSLRPERARCTCGSGCHSGCLRQQSSQTDASSRKSETVSKGKKHNIRCFTVFLTSCNIEEESTYFLIIYLKVKCWALANLVNLCGDVHILNDDQQFVLTAAFLKETMWVTLQVPQLLQIFLLPMSIQYRVSMSPDLWATYQFM